jgi:hypothetical protein
VPFLKKNPTKYRGPEHIDPPQNPTLPEEKQVPTYVRGDQVSQSFHSTWPDHAAEEIY